MLIVLIGRPARHLLIGPLGIWIGSAISALVYTIHGYLGWLSVAIMVALWPLLVMTGMHRVFTPTIIQTIAETGKEGMVMPSEIGRQPVARRLVAGGGVENQKTRSCARRRWRRQPPPLWRDLLNRPVRVAVRLKRPLIASLISGFNLAVVGRHGRSCQPLNGGTGAGPPAHSLTRPTR